jgi:hypothetical protein
VRGGVSNRRGATCDVVSCEAEADQEVGKLGMVVQGTATRGRVVWLEVMREGVALDAVGLVVRELRGRKRLILRKAASASQCKIKPLVCRIIMIDGEHRRHLLYRIVGVD